METQPDLVRPYVAQLGESATDTVAPPVTWAEAGPEPAPGGRSGHRGAGSQRRFRPGVVAAALVVAAVAAVILASTLDGSGADRANPGSGPAALLPTASSTAPPSGQSGPSGQSAQAGQPGRSATTAARQTGRPASSATATGATVGHPVAATARGGSADGTLRRGDQGPAVARLQQLLFDQGFTYVAVTGVYDDATTRGVTQLQQNRGLTADPPGVYGPQSRASLDPGN